MTSPRLSFLIGGNGTVTLWAFCMVRYRGYFLNRGPYWNEPKQCIIIMEILQKLTIQFVFLLIPNLYGYLKKPLYKWGDPSRTTSQEIHHFFLVSRYLRFFLMKKNPVKNLGWWISFTSGWLFSDASKSSRMFWALTFKPPVILVATTILSLLDEAFYPPPKAGKNTKAMDLIWWTWYMLIM